jgi:toxin ParE1/3/4
MPRVIRDRLAVADLDEIYDYIAVQNHSPAAADRFMDELDRKLTLYASQPRMGEARADLGEGVRVFSFRKSYVVIYRPIDDGIDVLRVFHGARDYPSLF